LSRARDTHKLTARRAMVGRVIIYMDERGNSESAKRTTKIEDFRARTPTFTTTHEATSTS
jgi:hypothetical protein